MYARARTRVINYSCISPGSLYPSSRSALTVGQEGDFLHPVGEGDARARRPRLAVLGEQLPIGARVRLDEKARPVPAALEEERVAHRLAVVGAHLQSARGVKLS